jgi:hypothetical protein
MIYRRQKWSLGQDLIGVIEAAGFVINAAKTRMQVRTGRQMVTGLTVNTKVNVPREYAHSARAMCNSVFRTGAYHSRLPANASSQDSASYEMITNLKSLSGILSYIYHIKHSSTLRSRSTTRVEAVSVPGEELYRQFLFFEYFVANTMPIIICEGRTDNIYLKYALRHLNSAFLNLSQETEHGFKPTVRLFNYENRVHKIMGLTGGFTALQKFIGQYTRRMRRYQHRPLLHPVMVLVGNDDAITSLKQNIKKYFNVEIDLTSTELFYHLTENL